MYINPMYAILSELSENDVENSNFQFLPDLPNQGHLNN